MIYLDNAATTPMLPCVKEALKNYIDDDVFGNPSSQHAVGERAAMLIEQARENVRKMFNAREDDVIIFTSGATEANNIVVNGIYAAFSRSSIEHSSVNPADCDPPDYEIAVGKNGVVRIDDFAFAAEKYADLISLMLANNETGAIQPVQNAAAIAHGCGILFHTDATAAAGHIPVDFQLLDADFLTFSGHKFGAPMGTGGLIAKADAAEKLSPIFAGGNQESGIRPGTENVMGIVGLGAAAEYYADKTNISHCVAHYIQLNSNFFNVLYDCLDNWHLNCYTDGVDCVRNIMSIRFPGVLGNTLVGLLSADGICISTGSACHSGEVKPSHVLRAMGQSDEEALSTVRVSFGLENTIGEVREAAKKIAETVRILWGVK